LLTEQLRRWEEQSTGDENSVEVPAEHAIPCLQYSGE
jgi:hypothetical protein